MKLGTHRIAPTPCNLERLNCLSSIEGTDLVYCEQERGTRILVEKGAMRHHGIWRGFWAEYYSSDARTVASVMC